MFVEVGDMFGNEAKTEADLRAVELARYIIGTGATVRQTAARFGVSKSTVHKDVTERLRTADAALWARVRAVLDTNKAQRHIRGGDATRRKYLEYGRRKAEKTAPGR